MRKYINTRSGMLPFSCLLTVIAGMIITGSCVKNNPYYTNFFDLHPIAEFFTGGPAINKAYIATQAAPTDYTIQVNLASPAPAPSALVVTLAVNPSAIDSLNASGSSYALLPDSVYTVTSWKVTIPAGQHQASLHVQVSTTKLDGAYQYILPLKITDASGVTISTNFGVGYWLVSAANPWVGLYHSAGYKKDAGVTTVINEDKYLYFADPNAGLGYGPNTVIGRAGDDVTYTDYGIGMDLTVDPVSDTVAVTTDPNQGTSKTPLFNNGICVYDPVRKTFTLNYAYVNAYGNTDSLYEVLTWKALPQ